MPPADEVIKWNLKIRNYENNWRYSTRSTSSPGLTVKTDICLLKSWIKEQQVAWRAKENQEKNLHTIYITTQHPQKLYYSFRLKLEEIFCLTIVLCSNRLFLSQHCPCQLLAGVFTGMAISLTRHFKKKNLYSEDLLIIQTTKPVRLSPETQIRLSCADHLTDSPSRKCLNKISHRFEITCCLMTVYVTNSKAQDDWILCNSES